MQTVDFLVLTTYLVVLFAITWHFRNASAKPEEFFLGGRKFGALPVGLSVMVTTFSAVNFLALPGEVSGFGLYVLASLPAFFLAAWPVIALWMPFFRRRGTVSVYAFLEERYDRKVRLLASTLFLIWRIFWMAVALYASCRVMSMLTGIGFGRLLFICGGAAALYAAIGGMKAVMWTDVMQFCVLLGSILLGVFLACRGEDFWPTLAAAGKLKPFSPADWSYLSPDPTLRITLWSALLGSAITFLTRFGADQMVMQRYLAARSLASARKGLLFNGVAATLSLGLLALFGLAVFVHARRTGLPAGTPPGMAVAALLKSFPPGAVGLIGAGLLAATMSSIDSGLNSCIAALTADFRLPPKKWLSPKLLTFALALVILAAAGWLLPLLNKHNTLFVLLNKSVNSMGTPLLAIMLCALFSRKIGAKALFWGGAAGWLLTILAGSTIRHLALHYYAVLSLLLTLAAITVCQFCFSRKK